VNGASVRENQAGGKLADDRRPDGAFEDAGDAPTHSELTAEEVVEANPELRSRYGHAAPRRLKERWWLAIGAAAVLVIFALWAAWAGWIPTGSAPPLTTTSGAANVMGAHDLQLTYSVETNPGNTVACALEAVDTEFTIVGWKVVVHKVEKRDTAYTVNIRTTHKSATGDISECWLPTVK
jgi:hypothetical protein